MGLSLLVLPGALRAQTSDATMAVRLSVGSSSQGAFNFNGLLATRVGVFARSGFQARLSSATGLAGPTSGTVRAGGSFTVDVPRLYTAQSAGASNPYTVELSWQDTTPRTAMFGPFNLVRGTNTVGPFTVTNDAPPAPSSISCYPQPPRTESELYVYWSGPSPRPSDFARFELHRGTTAGFTPSSSTLITQPPWGTSNRVVTGNNPGTGYYFCIRIVDAYGAWSDRCTTTACRTTDAMRDAGTDTGVDTGVDVGTDLGTDTGVDVGTDLGTDTGVDTGVDTGTDLGTDAGEPDAGMPDAGMPDTGMPDAGMPDAGMPDVGMPDAGMPDAGMPDTGRPDMGRPDASRPEAGMPDVPRPDMGMPDAAMPMDAGAPTDAAMMGDAAIDPNADAATMGDGATDPNAGPGMTGQEDGGCSAGARPTGRAGAAVWLLGLAALGLRRRARRGV